MEEDIRKQGMLYLQQQRFGKVGTAAASRSANANRPTQAFTPQLRHPRLLLSNSAVITM